jgi:hypothetical protein
MTANNAHPTAAKRLIRKGFNPAKRQGTRPPRDRFGRW